MKLNHSNIWLASVQTLLLLFLISLNIQINDKRPHVPWVVVQARLIDVAVVSNHSAVLPTSAYNHMKVQYVYQFDWNQKRYTSRDLVTNHNFQTNKLTSGEARIFLLNNYLKPGAGIDVWINPENPHQSVVKLQTKIITFRTLLLYATTMLFIWLSYLWWRRW